MTENDPNAHANSGVPAGPPPGEQPVWSAAPGAEPGHSEPSTPPRGIPLGADQAYGPPNPWSAQAQQPSAPYAQPVQPGVHGSQYGTSAYTLAPPPQEKPARAGSGKLVAGVAVLALLVGGGAGALGGYVAGGDGSTALSANALNAPKPAQQTGNAPAGSVEAVANKLLPSVVELQVQGGNSAGEGSGFILSQDGYILTNNHVVEVAANGGQIQALFQDGRKAAAKVVGRDPTTDIAVVKVDGMSGLTPVELGRSDDLRVGQGVVAVGSPFELAGTVTSGIVSSLHRPVRAGGSNGDQTTVMDAVQTDAAINPGNSGGPLANTAGQVIGINSAIYSPQSSSGMQQSQGGNVGIGFAIPIDQARRTADDIIKTGQAVQTFIGAQVTDAPSGGAQLGAITPGSPAEKAGLKSGDVVTKIDDRPIDNADALVAAIRTRAPNEKVQLTLSDSRVVEATLGGQPVPPN
ncbi:MAG: putative serine protease PepD [Actinomycetota bacterium]|nr:putative serine protease PepD [Actinomycetota bacterium]